MRKYKQRLTAYSVVVFLDFAVCVAVLTTFLLLLLGLCSKVLATEPPETPETPSNIEVYFTPSDQCKNRIIEAIHKETDAILMSAYSFTDVDIAQALLRAQQRDVVVKLTVDKLQSQGKSQIALLEQINPFIDIRLSKGVKIDHHKSFIFLGQNMVETGSYNFSNNASKYNAENCLFIKGDSSVVVKYKIDFQSRWERYTNQ